MELYTDVIHNLSNSIYMYIYMTCTCIGVHSHNMRTMIPAARISSSTSSGVV